ncbi:MAG: DUF3159 domain-containing protein [Candidatus Nanopelagicales bacterium]|nr:DUF3159 domain-containing protein [Candidatus Nanopelagicales bacterium]MBJ7393968.1 DUF3159 domain-containing protein [Candidatus Nanopelagicales bacterium]
MSNPENMGEKELLNKAIGGWRGLVDSGLPSMLFILIFVFQQNLNNALIAALILGGILLLIRLIERKPLTQVLSGFVGLSISVLITWRTKDASNFFLTGIITNAVYGFALLVSVLIRKPLIGYLVGSLVGDTSGWLKHPLLVRAYTIVTWIWVAVFGIRLVVQIPLYLNDSVALLGSVKIFMGWPLYLFAVWVTYQIVKTARAKII